MNKKHLSFGVQLKAADATQGTIEAIVSVFNNVDRGGERIRPGFFAKSLAKKLPKGVWMHDWKQPVAKTLEARELLPGDPLLPPELVELGGLYIKGQFNLSTQRGKEAFSDIQFGTVDEFSIGFTIERYEVDRETEIVDLIEGELFEWSPVLVGMNQATSLISAKDFEAGTWPKGLAPDKQVELLLAGAADLQARFAQFEKDREQGLSPERIAKVRELAAKLNGFADSCKRSASPGDVRLLEARVLENAARLAGLIPSP